VQLLAHGLPLAPVRHERPRRPGEDEHQGYAEDEFVELLAHGLPLRPVRNEWSRRLGEGERWG
jgi:hypothetical protein